MKDVLIHTPAIKAARMTFCSRPPATVIVPSTDPPSTALGLFAKVSPPKLKTPSATEESTSNTTSRACCVLSSDQNRSIFASREKNPVVMEARASS